MRYLTAGESHGEMLVGIIEGLPSGFCVDEAVINADLARRQQGYGRGGRMQIERDAAHIVSGVRNGVALGSPIALLVPNRDYENWKAYTDPRGCDVTARTVTAVRPGHADYVGCKKFDTTDARNILERSSARNTASIVALGGVCRQFLSALGVAVGSYVTQIGAVRSDKTYESFDEIVASDASPVRVLDRTIEQACLDEIDLAKAQGDTVGGAFTVVVSGLKPCIGSCMSFEQKLDTALMGAVGGLQGIKAVSVGAGNAYASTWGSAIHDAMYPDGEGGVRRLTNNAGGIEGGMTNGEDVVISAVFKPIPTTMKGLATVDLVTGEATVSGRERSDVCAVPAAAVVAEALVMLELTQAILCYTGGSNMREICSRWK